MTDEDLIESAPRPKSAWRRRSAATLRHPAGAAALLILGLLVGSIGGFAVGHSNPRPMAGVGYYFIASEVLGSNPLGAEPFDPYYGRPPLPTLTRADMSTIGEQVNRDLSILSAQSAIPVLCGTGVGQPGTDFLDVSYPSTVFRVDGGQFTQLMWPHADGVSASRTLHTLVFQAQLCPQVPSAQATVRSSGVLSGTGDEYVIFSRAPTAAGPNVDFATVTLVRVGADLIEVSFISDIASSADQDDAEARCLRVAAAAVEKASAG